MDKPVSMLSAVAFSLAVFALACSSVSDHRTSSREPHSLRESSSAKTPAEHDSDAGGDNDSPVLYDSFKQPFGADTVALGDTKAAPLTFSLVSTDKLGTATVTARDTAGNIAAYVYDDVDHGTFKVTESAAMLSQDDLLARLKIHPASVTDSVIALVGGDALVESNDGYIEVTLLVGDTQIVIFGPTSGFSMAQATKAVDAFAAERTMQ